MDRNWNEILQELRVTQTGTQIFTGFLLTIAFQTAVRRSDDLPDPCLPRPGGRGRAYDRARIGAGEPSSGAVPQERKETIVQTAHVIMRFTLVRGSPSC